MCQQSFTKNQNPPTHRCFLNWKKTSTAMEADAVVEGFSSSLHMHGLKYNKLIGNIFKLQIINNINN